MEVFSTVVVEISATAFALLPAFENNDYERQGKIHYGEDGITDGDEHMTNHRAKFLEEKLKELNINVVVMCEISTDTTSSLKLYGGWSEICAVRIWLMQLIETTEMQNASNREHLEVGTRCKAAVTKQCIESSLDRPRRSLRNRRPAKQDNADAMLSSSLAASKQIKANVSKQNNVQMKKHKVLTNSAEGKYGSTDKSEVLESYANCNTVVDKAHINGSVEPITVLTDEQIATTNSDAENDSALNMHTGGMSCSEFTQQSKEPLDFNASERKLTLKELKCESCEYITNKQRNLAMHIARTHSDRCFICPTCDRRFGVAKDLNQHLKCHTEKYCCELCGQTLKSKYAVALHVARVHKGLAPRPVKRYLCTLCGKMCRNRTDYNVHRNKEHTGVRPYCCDACSASFFSRSNLHAHRQIHTDARKYECSQCGKAFKQRQGLRIHQAVHLVERPYKCEYCSKAFTQHSALIRHTRTHTSARPFTCRLCPSTFNDYSILRRHMMGIHKLQDAAEVRHSVQAACAEARLAQHLSVGSQPASSVASTVVVDSSVNSIVVSSNEDTKTSIAAVGIDNGAGISDVQLGTSAGQLLATLVLSSLSSSQGHIDTRASVTDSLPQYFLPDALRSALSHQHNL